MLEFEQTESPQPVPTDLRGLAESGVLSAGLVASFHALHGQVDSPLAWLQKAVEDRSWIDLYLRVNPIFDVVRAEDGFTDVVRQLSA